MAGTLVVPVPRIYRINIGSLVGFKWAGYIELSSKLTVEPL